MIKCIYIILPFLLFSCLKDKKVDFKKYQFKIHQGKIISSKKNPFTNHIEFITKYKQEYSFVSYSNSEYRKQSILLEDTLHYGDTIGILLNVNFHFDEVNNSLFLLGSYSKTKFGEWNEGTNDSLYMIKYNFESDTRKMVNLTKYLSVFSVNTIFPENSAFIRAGPSVVEFTNGFEYFEFNYLDEVVENYAILSSPIFLTKYSLRSDSNYYSFSSSIMSIHDKNFNNIDQVNFIDLNLGSIIGDILFYDIDVDEKLALVYNKIDILSVNDDFPAAKLFVLNYKYSNEVDSVEIPNYDVGDVFIDAAQTIGAGNFYLFGHSGFPSKENNFIGTNILSFDNLDFNLYYFDSEENSIEVLETFEFENGIIPLHAVFENNEIVVVGNVGSVYESSQNHVVVTFSIPD